MSVLVQVVNAVKATQRIPKDTPAAVTFFSEKDEWVFFAVIDNRVCMPCLKHEFHTYKGEQLRSLFQDLEITSLETISPNVHPNCRCYLQRIVFYGDIGTERVSKASK